MDGAEELTRRAFSAALIRVQGPEDRLADAFAYRPSGMGQTRDGDLGR